MPENFWAISYLKNKTKSFFVNRKSSAQFDSTELTDAVQITFAVCTEYRKSLPTFDTIFCTRVAMTKHTTGDELIGISELS